MSDKMTKAERVDLAPQADPFTAFLERAARDPDIDVDKLERLLAIKERQDAQERKRRFFDALARLQERMPQIAKSGAILDRDGGLRNKYAKLEDIDRVVRPICAEEGFAFTFDAKPAQGGTEYSCAMSHRDGHVETKTLVLPLDSGAGRNAVQSVGSSTSYARRYLLEMHLNLVRRDEDDDGNGGPKPVTQMQADEIRERLKSLGRDEGKFLNWACAATFEEIPAANYARCIKAIEEMARRVKP